MHAAQNERLPLRVIVQVLFFEQLRLRTTVASWFFISDNIDNSRDPHIQLPKNNDGFIHSEIMQETEQASSSMDEVRLRVCELEKECSSLRQEVEKLGKAKSVWNFFSKKFGFGVRSQQHCDAKQVSMDDSHFMKSC